MSRKNNGMYFEVHPSPKKDEAGNNYVYVRPSMAQHLSTDELGDYCHRFHNTHEEDMKRALTAFRNAATQLLANGATIDTPFGSFSPRLGLLTPKTTADKVEASDVVLEGIEFRPKKEFLHNVKMCNEGFRAVNNPDSQKLASDKEHLDRALQRTIEENHGRVTVSSFMKNSGLRRHSAQQQLDRWTEGESPRLMRTKISRIYVYTEI